MRVNAIAISQSWPKQADRRIDALQEKEIMPFMPGRKRHMTKVKYDMRRRRIASRYDGCTKVFLSAVIFAATVLF